MESGMWKVVESGKSREPSSFYFLLFTRQGAP